MIDKQHLIDRFVGYVTVDTESDPASNATPSTAKQWDLANALAEELKRIGMQEVTIDENAYIMATLPSNIDEEVPVVGFISHFDTSPDFTGANVKPQFVENYDGGDIVLNEAKNIVLSPKEFDDLLLYKGKTLITTDGTTLLGADDKAGVAEIISAMEDLIQHPEIKHGKIRVGFTPDEEIGRGAHKFDVEKFGADWAYTMDGSQTGWFWLHQLPVQGTNLQIVFLFSNFPAPTTRTLASVAYPTQKTPEVFCCSHLGVHFSLHYLSSHASILWLDGYKFLPNAEKHDLAFRCDLHGRQPAIAIHVSCRCSKPQIFSQTIRAVFLKSYHLSGY